MENSVGRPIVYLSFPKSTSIYMAWTLYLKEQDQERTYWGIVLDYFNVQMFHVYMTCNDLSEYKRKLNNI